MGATKRQLTAEAYGIILNLLSSDSPIAANEIERLIGKPITRCPPARSTHLSAYDILDRIANRDNPYKHVRTIIEVAFPADPPRSGRSGRPRLNTPTWAHHIRPGVTRVETLHALGVSPEATAAAIKAGYLRLK